jgi:hydrogenase maturation protease
MSTAHAQTILLGIGNTLWADEGFGPQVIARMQEAGDLPAQVDLVDGGTQGLYLLPLVQDAARLIVFDAVDFNRPPGAMVVLRDDEIPAFFGQRPLSLHQTGFTDVLAAAELTGRRPHAITLIGVQYANIDTWGGGLSPAVAAAIEPAIAASRRELQSWKETPHV